MGRAEVQASRASERECRRRERAPTEGESAGGRVRDSIGSEKGESAGGGRECQWPCVRDSERSRESTVEERAS
jgi:hypothetical protein